MFLAVDPITTICFTCPFTSVICVMSTACFKELYSLLYGICVDHLLLVSCTDLILSSALKTPDSSSRLKVSSRHDCL